MRYHRRRAAEEADRPPPVGAAGIGAIDLRTRPRRIAVGVDDHVNRAPAVSDRRVYDLLLPAAAAAPVRLLRPGVEKPFWNAGGDHDRNRSVLDTPTTSDSRTAQSRPCWSGRSVARCRGRPAFGIDTPRGVRDNDARVVVLKAEPGLLRVGVSSSRWRLRSVPSPSVTAVPSKAGVSLPSRLIAMSRTSMGSTSEERACVAGGCKPQRLTFRVSRQSTETALYERCRHKLHRPSPIFQSSSRSPKPHVGQVNIKALPRAEVGAPHRSPPAPDVEQLLGGVDAWIEDQAMLRAARIIA